VGGAAPPELVERDRDAGDGGGSERDRADQELPAVHGR
jgi:hypothetical protein